VGGGVLLFVSVDLPEITAGSRAAAAAAAHIDRGRGRSPHGRLGPADRLAACQCNHSYCRVGRDWSYQQRVAWSLDERQREREKKPRRRNQWCLERCRDKL